MVATEFDSVPQPTGKFGNLIPKRSAGRYRCSKIYHFHIFPTISHGVILVLIYPSLIIKLVNHFKLHSSIWFRRMVFQRWSLQIQNLVSLQSPFSNQISCTIIEYDFDNSYSHRLVRDETDVRYSNTF